MGKEPKYKNRKPDLETESLRAWISNKDEAKEIEKIAKKEKHEIIIDCENNFKMRLMGFTKFIDQKSDKIIFAFKLKKESKTIIYYVPDYLEEEQQNKIKIFLEKLKNMAELSKFEMVDGKEFVEISADEASRLTKHLREKIENKNFKNRV